MNLDMYEADGYYIKECYDNKKDKHVYIDEDLCYYSFLQCVWTWVRVKIIHRVFYIYVYICVCIYMHIHIYAYASSTHQK